MKRNYSSLLFVSFLGALMLLGAGLANAKGGGGGVPSPLLSASNHRVELADGELYLLEGSISFDDLGQAVFWVDLRKEPWLANKERIQNPYYKLEGTREQWNEYAGKTIILACIAKGLIRDGAYRIELIPADSDVQKTVSDPVSVHHHIDGAGEN